MMIKVSDLVFKEIARRGVKHVFMLPGGGCMHLVDSLGRNKDMEYICCLHEQAAAIAAEAYGQNTGNLGVVLVTAGPGSTNAITGVAGAWIDSTPVLVLSGQAKTDDLMTGRGVRQMGIQEVDTVAIVSPITKYACCVKDPLRIRYELKKAIHMAQTGRKGPVWLDLPLDVQGAMVDEDALACYTPPPEPSRDTEINHAAQRLLELIAASRRPAILAGNGIRHANTIGDFLALAESLKLPVLTTWKTADFLPEDHPLFVGRPGIVAQRGANFVQQTCDCLLIIGARLDLCQTGFNHPGFAPHAQKIIVDIDSAEIDKLNMPFALRLVADAGQAIKAVLAQSRGFRAPDFSGWLATCKDWQRRYPVILPEYCDETKPLVNLYHLIDTLSRILPPDAVLVPGSSGACAEVTLQAVKVKPGLRIQNTPGLGSMGFGLPATLGACLAAGNKLTVGIVGDGGLQHNIQELETLRRLNLPIKIFVLNNNGYGSIYAMQKNRFAGHLVACNPSSGLTLPDTCKVAEAYGLRTRKIASPLHLAEQVQAVLDLPGTVICEVMTDPDVPSVPRLSSKVLPDGRMESLPMEDLWPYLDREEFSRNMRDIP